MNKLYTAIYTHLLVVCMAVTGNTNMVQYIQVRKIAWVGNRPYMEILKIFVALKLLFGKIDLAENGVIRLGLR